MIHFAYLIITKMMPWSSDFKSFQRDEESFFLVLFDVRQRISGDDNNSSWESHQKMRNETENDPSSRICSTFATSTIKMTSPPTLLS